MLLWFNGISCGIHQKCYYGSMGDVVERSPRFSELNDNDVVRRFWGRNMLYRMKISLVMLILIGCIYLSTEPKIFSIE